MLSKAGEPEFTCERRRPAARASDSSTVGEERGYRGSGRRNGLLDGSPSGARQRATVAYLRAAKPADDCAPRTGSAEKILELEQQLASLSAKLSNTIAQQTMLNSISQKIIAQTDPSMILPEIVKSAVILLGGYGGSITLKEESRPGCRNVALYNLPEELEGLYLPPGKSLSSYVLDHAQPAIVEDYSTYPHRNPLLAPLRFKSTICVPLRVEDEVIGTLLVNTNDPGRRFAEEDLGVLTSFANQAAIAIKNAQLHAQNLEQLARLSEAKRRLAQQSRRLRELLARTFHAQEEERKRIAADVHDGITQFIVAATMEAYAAKTALCKDPEVAAERLESVEQLLTQSLRDLRQVIQDLRPRMLDERGLLSALDHLAGHFREVSGISCAFFVTGNQVGLSPTKEIAIYRIVQESLNNVLKHAKASKVVISLSFGARELSIDITDNGRGFSPDEVDNLPAHGLGLTSMRERAESVGASFIVEASPGKGAKLMLSVPIDRRPKARVTGKEDYGGQ